MQGSFCIDLEGFYYDLSFFSNFFKILAPVCSPSVYCFPKLKAIIEIDGPSHFLPIWGEEKLQKQIKADEVKTGLILSRGFIIIRVKNLHNSISLHNQEQLKNNLIAKLIEIEGKQYSDTNRYIEIEV